MSFLPSIQADVVRPTPFVIEEQFNFSATGDGIALSNGHYKLVHFYDHFNEFFDVLNDPYESTNLLAAPLAADAQSNYNAVLLKLGDYQTFANTNYTRNLVQSPQINAFGFTNGTFNLEAQFTEYTTNGLFPNSNQQYPTELTTVNSSEPGWGQTNLNYEVILWRTSDLSNPLGWSPVATNLVNQINSTYLVSTNGWLVDANASADHYFYRVSPYIP